MNIWLECLRKQLRFNSYGVVSAGILSAEDLFELNDKELQQIYRQYSKEYRELTEDVLDISIENKEANEALIKRDVIRGVYTIKLSEKMATQKAQEREETRQEILSIMAEKQKDELKDLSIEELQAKLDAL